jgi:hypothetical protein
MRDQTTVGCLNRSATFRRRSLNRCIIASKTSRPSLLYGLLRLESDKRWYHLQRGSISVTG